MKLRHLPARLFSARASLLTTYPGSERHGFNTRRSPPLVGGGGCRWGQRGEAAAAAETGAPVNLELLLLSSSHLSGGALPVRACGCACVSRRDGWIDKKMDGWMDGASVSSSSRHPAPRVLLFLLLLLVFFTKSAAWPRVGQSCRSARAKPAPITAVVGVAVMKKRMMMAVIAIILLLI